MKDYLNVIKKYEESLHKKEYTHSIEEKTLIFTTNLYDSSQIVEECKQVEAFVETVQEFDPNSHRQVTLGYATVPIQN